MGGEELKYIQEAFDQNWIAPVGPNIDNFEKELAAYLRVKDVAVLTTGTAALHLALILLGVGPGDHVLVQSFTYCATANPVVYLGATPVFIDSEPQTWNMDPELLEEAIIKLIRQNPSNKPKAIIPVHLYGIPARIDRIVEIADKYDIPVIEDAAEGLGCTFRGKHVGTFGKMGMISFNGNKIITTSGGGVLISDDTGLIEKAKFLATQAKDKALYYQHTQIGYNYRMSNIVAGIGRGQLEVLQNRIEKRRDNFLFYKGNLSGIKGILFKEEPGEEFFSNRWLTTILIDPEITGTNWEEVHNALEKENIETRPLWKPMHLQPVFEKYPTFVNGVSESLFNKGLCLPSGTNLTDEDKERILRGLIRCFNK